MKTSETKINIPFHRMTKSEDRYHARKQAGAFLQYLSTVEGEEVTEIRVTWTPHGSFGGFLLTKKGKNKADRENKEPILNSQRTIKENLKPILDSKRTNKENIEPIVDSKHGIVEPFLDPKRGIKRKRKDSLEPLKLKIKLPIK